MGSARDLTLAFDTAGAHCAGAMLSGDRIVAERFLSMARGQAEALMPMLEDLLAGAGAGWDAVSLIAVGVGPGNFTGTRVSVAAARGLALALRVPARGVSAFETMRDPAGLSDHPQELVSIEAPRGAAYVQRFAHGQATGAPLLVDPAAPGDIGIAVRRVRGYRAGEIARALGAEASEAAAVDIAPRLARIARWRLARGEDPARPAPLYVRPADAAPMRDVPPTILPG